MLLTQHLEYMSDLLDDPKHAKFPIDTVVRCTDVALLGLHRTLTASNKQWSNFTMLEYGANARQILQNAWEWRLPSWITGISRIYQRPKVDLGMTSMSPYEVDVKFSPPEAQNEIRKSTHGYYPRWTWEGTYTLRMWNFTTAPDLIIMLAKKPAKVFQAKVTTPYLDGYRINLPSSLLLGEFDLDLGAYINASVRVTGTQDVNATHYGETRRCVNSTAIANAASSRNTQLLMDAPYSNVIAAGDTIETLIPLPDEQCRYLQLKTAQACYQKKPAFDAMKALQGELMEEGAKFMQYATPPRDTRGPTFYRSPRFDPIPYEQNHRRNWWA